MPKLKAFEDDPLDEALDHLKTLRQLLLAIETVTTADRLLERLLPTIERTETSINRAKETR